MAFIVEDGTGVENANAYVDTAFVDAYHADRGNAEWVGSPTVKEQAIIRSTDFIDVRWGEHFKGDKVDEDQSLQFPRTVFEGVPLILKRAAAEYALRALSGALMPDISVDETGLRVSRKTEIVGPIEETTEYRAQGTITLIKPSPAADRMLWPLLNGSFMNGRSIRA